MKGFPFLLTIIQMMVATHFSWAQEKIGPSYIPFTNEIGCAELFDVPTIGEVMATSDTLTGPKRDLLLQEYQHQKQLILKGYEDEGTPKVVFTPKRIVVLIPISDDQDDYVHALTSDDEDDYVHSLTSEYEDDYLYNPTSDNQDDYAIKAIVVEEDEYGDYISVSILRNDGWLFGDPEYRSMEYISLAGYISFLQEHIFMDSHLLYKAPGG